MPFSPFMQVASVIVQGSGNQADGSAPGVPSLLDDATVHRALALLPEVFPAGKPGDPSPREVMERLLSERDMIGREAARLQDEAFRRSVADDVAEREGLDPASQSARADMSESAQRSAETARDAAHDLCLALLSALETARRAIVSSPCSDAPVLADAVQRIDAVFSAPDAAVTEHVAGIERAVAEHVAWAMEREGHHSYATALREFYAPGRSTEGWTITVLSEEDARRLFGDA
jgi:hypothetical protein